MNYTHMPWISSARIPRISQTNNGGGGDAYAYLLKAAVLGHPDAQFRLSMFYIEDIGRRFTEDLVDTVI